MFAALFYYMKFKSNDLVFVKVRRKCTKILSANTLSNFKDLINSQEVS